MGNPAKKSEENDNYRESRAFRNSGLDNIEFERLGWLELLVGGVGIVGIATIASLLYAYAKYYR